MNGIQILLISGVVIIFAYYISSFRNALFDLVALCLFAGAGIFIILFPDYTNKIAHQLGVGRGADLLFYSCILFFLFITLKLFSRIRRLEDKLKKLVQQQAQENVRNFQEEKKQE